LQLVSSGLNLLLLEFMLTLGIEKLSGIYQ